MKKLILAVALLLLSVAATPAGAVAGWLLLFPPSSNVSRDLVLDTDAPLPLWKKFSSGGQPIIYATERLCQMVRSKMIDQSTLVLATSSQRSAHLTYWQA